GSFRAQFWGEEGGTMVAVCDGRGGVYKPAGLDVSAVLAHKQETGEISGLRGAEPITNEELLLVDCDVLAPCALEQVITTDNAGQIRAKIICEGAHRPTTPAPAGNPQAPR